LLDPSFPFLLKAEGSLTGLFPFSLINSEGNLVVIKKINEKQFLLTLTTKEFETIKENGPFEGDIDTVNDYEDFAVLGCAGRSLHLFNMKTLEVTDSFQAPGHGVFRQIRVGLFVLKHIRSLMNLIIFPILPPHCPFCSQLNKELLVTPSDNGQFYNFLIKEGKALEQKPFKGPPGVIHFFDWIDENLCCACNDSEIWVFPPTVQSFPSFNPVLK